MNTAKLFTAMSRTGESIWMAHADYPGYFATEDGRVFSGRKLRFMRPIRLGKYVGLQLVHRERGLVKVYLHRLMLVFSTGINPQGLQACHNNGDRHDNRRENLRWDTPAGNHADKALHGTSAKGEANPMARLTDADAQEIRRLWESGVPQRRLAADYRVSPMTVNRLVRGISWSHVQ